MLKDRFVFAEQRLVDYIDDDIRLVVQEKKRGLGCVI
jgi:hypothetical protein